MRVLVTGATGYVGGRLVPALLDAGHDVVCLTRSRSRLRGVPWRERVEVVEGDALDVDSLRPAMEQVDAAYYLVHALGSGREFEERDRRAAQTFAAVSREGGVRRLVYLGGLSPVEGALSPHLRSRAEV